jgi:hypothetical protein
MHRLALSLLFAAASAFAADAQVRAVRNNQPVAVSATERLAAKLAALVESCSVNSTAYAVSAETWSRLLASDSFVRVSFSPSRRLLIERSDNQAREERAIHEILLPLTEANWAEHVFVRTDDETLSFTKYSPFALREVVLEQELRLRTVPRYDSLVTATEAPVSERPDPLVAERITRLPSRLCPEHPRPGSPDAVRNSDRLPLRELLGIAPRSILVHYRSADWKAPGDIADQVREILEARPRSLSRFINWSEGADLRSRGFVASVQTADGASARLEVAGYQVCVRDIKGSYWYFRNVPLDLWGSR